MIQASDILAATKARWDRDGSLKGLVPGGLHHEGPDPERHPYARLMAEEQEVELNSGSHYVTSFLVTVMVWSTAGAVNTGAIAQRVDRIFNRDRPQDFLILGGRVMGIQPVSGPLEIPEETREAKDVLLLHRRYTLMVQGQV